MNAIMSSRSFSAPTGCKRIYSDMQSLETVAAKNKPMIFLDTCSIQDDSKMGVLIGRLAKAWDADIIIPSEVMYESLGVACLAPGALEGAMQRIKMS